ncbi:MAG: glycosyltransferase family 1 protein [Bacteroidia bacterium]|nr:glycosyltransferase family 1 protein [Bacteroidia bacterium]
MPKILFLLEDYNYFYSRKSTGLFKIKYTYLQALNALLQEKYYQSNSLALAFESIGFETNIIVPEANPLQLQWLKEHNTLLLLKWWLLKPIRSFKARVLKQYRSAYNTTHFMVLLKQVELLKPEYIYVYSNIYLTEKQVTVLKSYCRKIILQWTTPLWKEFPKFPYHKFDIIVTAALQLHEYFKGKFYFTLYIQQAFDDSLLQTMNKIEHKNFDVTFIGGFTLGHNFRFEVLEFLLQNNINLSVYGTGRESLPKNSLVFKYMKAPLFGLEMYNVYRKSKIAIHIHTTGYDDDQFDWNKYAGAKRLFEITGAGALLIASHQENIKDLFIIDREVVTFKTNAELLYKVRYYLANPSEAEEIAKRGQLRTLTSHSFVARAMELKPYLLE